MFLAIFDPMPFYRHLLWPFAILYGLGVWCRNKLFDLGILPSTSFPIPVICVGNLEVGGTGKSPVVMYVLNLLSKSGLKVAMLSRGYGRKTRGFRMVETSDAAEQVGDEPLQAKLRFPDIPVVVCENRVEGTKQLLARKNPPDLVVMDDGFQHRWIKPSFSILVTAATRPFWKNHLLPVGTLREGKNGAHRADVILVNGDGENQPDVGLPVFRTRVVSGSPVQIAGDDLKLNANSEVLIFSGIANSHRFNRLAERHFKVIDHVAFADHHIYSGSDFDLLNKKLDSFGTAVKAVVTTEKDAARLRNTSLLTELNLPVFYLPIEVEIENEEAFDKLILEHGKYAGKNK